MILLVDLCYRPHSLGEDEFVCPIKDIIERCGYPSKICHFTEWDTISMDGVDAVILCGAPLRDKLFVQMTECFTWIPTSPVPILGICAGMQALVLAYGGSLKQDTQQNTEQNPDKRPKIGMTAIRCTQTGDPIFREKQWTGYQLYRFSTIPGNNFIALAESDTGVQAIRHRNRPVYGVMFHPEVRNAWVVERFLSLHVRHDAPCSSDDLSSE
jgi:GMP synthase (glutamine-hydrolysing)